ncbi:DUF5959 family protein [Streptomyces sp. NPDC058284]|uniref:DUF5959 family protein n=1 Tax=unclassified Streptomyces TaxID=2593676 RepID=UPI00365378F9
MTDNNPADLILLADEEGNSVRVTVLGRYPGQSDMLTAEISVETPFVRGRLDLALWSARLSQWSQVLDRLEAGEDAGWMTAESGPTLSLQLAGEHDCPEVLIKDTTISMVTVRVPVDLPDEWVSHHRTRLRQVLGSWPLE